LARLGEIKSGFKTKNTPSKRNKDKPIERMKIIGIELNHYGAGVLGDEN